MLAPVGQPMVRASDDDERLVRDGLADEPGRLSAR
jgi:hypothetical protein